MEKNIFYPFIDVNGCKKVITLPTDSAGWLDGAYRAIGNDCHTVEPIYVTDKDGNSFVAIVDEEGLLKKNKMNFGVMGVILNILVEMGLERKEVLECLCLLVGNGFFARVDEEDDRYIGWTSEQEAMDFLEKYATCTADDFISFV